MPEKASVIVGRSISFEGVFSVSGICGLIDGFFDKRAYSRNVVASAETVKPVGKFIKFVTVYKRTINDYARYEIEIALNFENITAVDVVKGGAKVKLNKGQVSVGIDSWVITDYDKSWETKPTFYFLRTLMNKFFFKSIHQQWEADTKRDVEDLCTEIGSYFNLQQYQK